MVDLRNAGGCLARAYPWREAVSTAPRALKDEAFLEAPFFGTRQMTRHLVNLGHAVGLRRVRRLMRIMGLRAIYQRPRTTIPHPEHKIYPYLLRNVEVSRPNHVDLPGHGVSRGVIAHDSMQLEYRLSQRVHVVALQGLSSFLRQTLEFVSVGEQPLVAGEMLEAVDDEPVLIVEYTDGDAPHVNERTSKP